MKNSAKKLITAFLSALLICVSLTYFGCGSRDYKATPVHLISESEAEQNPVRPIDGRDERTVVGNDALERQTSLLQIVKSGFKPVFESDSETKTVYETAVNILNRYIKNSFDEFERVHAIHDYLASAVVYDVALYNEYLSGINVGKEHDSFNLFGAIVSKKAVCDGISKAFSLMCAIEGIESALIYGEYTTEGGVAAHVWNKVKVDGNWYNADVTLDTARVDIAGEQRRYVHHGFFLISDRRNEAETFGAHRADPDYEVNPVNEATPDEGYGAYESMYIDAGGESHCAALRSEEELTALLRSVGKAKKQVAALDIQLCFEGVNEDRIGAFDYYLKTALAEVRNTDFPFDPGKGIRPYVQYPDGVILLFIYR
ncbi:MAG: hypothetical protein HFE48_02800 [Clostridia bacterium]|nr:hypothetical protein [Clostridia bacterium]